MGSATCESERTTSESGRDYAAHETAIIDEGAQIGCGTRIWHWVHICGGANIGEICSRTCLWATASSSDWLSVGRADRAFSGFLRSGALTAPQLAQTSKPYCNFIYWIPERPQNALVPKNYRLP